MEDSRFQHFFFSPLNTQRARLRIGEPPAIDYFSLGHFIVSLIWR
jgi:hypothetical protein